MWFASIMMFAGQPIIPNAFFARANEATLVNMVVVMASAITIGIIMAGYDLRRWRYRTHG